MENNNHGYCDDCEYNARRNGGTAYHCSKHPLKAATLPTEAPMPTPKAEPFAVHVWIRRCLDAAEWRAYAMLVRTNARHDSRGPVEMGGECIGLGVAATPEEAERQAREDAKARLLSTANEVAGE